MYLYRTFVVSMCVCVCVCVRARGLVHDENKNETRTHTPALGGILTYDPQTYKHWTKSTKSITIATAQCLLFLAMTSRD